jgi:hypothetical protein
MTAYGYLSVGHSDSGMIEDLVLEMHDYAKAQGFFIDKVYVDGNMRPELLVRPALTEMLDVTQWRHATGANREEPSPSF